MKTYDLPDRRGQVSAFEVSSAITRGGALGVVRRIPGVRLIPGPDGSAYHPGDVFGAFELGGVRFHLWEPFGDNSRFWIGPDPVRPVPELASVRDAFARTGLLAAIFSPAG